MQYILIIAITSTMFASGTSSSLTTAVFDSKENCEVAGKQVENDLGQSQLISSKLKWTCVQK